MRVAVTGHRPEEFDGTDWAAESAKTWLELMAEFLRDDPRFEMTEGISGMSRGVDLWWADHVLRAGVALNAYVPFWRQPQKWPAGDVNLWGLTIGAATDVKVFGKSEPYDVGLFWERNRGMVDDCDLLLVVCNDKTSGGTYGTWNYAHKSGRSWIRYNPWDNSVDASPDVEEIFK